MTKAVLLVFAICISIPAFAQPLADTSSLDSLRSVVQQLQEQWQKQWRASDSLRITSILTRLRADSITRSIKTTEKAIADAQRRREAELQREAQRRLSEQDAADSNVPVSESAIESAQERRDTSPPNQFPEQQGIEKRVDDGASGESIDATADDATAEILQTLALQSAARTAAQKLQTGKPKRGETLSDSLTYHVLTMKPDTGIASYYASEFHGKRSSNGEVFNMNSLTCAHRWLPFGTIVLVTNLDNGKSVVVKVTDRGPFKHGRILDVSKKAATLLGMIKSGTARVCIQVSQPSPELEDSTRIDAPEADSTASP